MDFTREDQNFRSHGIDLPLRRQRETCSIMRACELAGVSRRTIYNWMKAHKVEFIRTAGGSVRIYVDTLFRSASGERIAAPETQETQP